MQRDASARRMGEHAEAADMRPVMLGAPSGSQTGHPMMAMPPMYMYQQHEPPVFLHQSFADYGQAAQGQFMQNGYRAMMGRPDMTPVPPAYERAAAQVGATPVGRNDGSSIEFWAEEESRGGSITTAESVPGSRKRKRESAATTGAAGRRRTRAERNRESAEKSRQRQKMRNERLELDVYTKRMENRKVKASIDSYYAQLREVAEAIERQPEYAAKVPSLFNSLDMIQSAMESCVWTYKNLPEDEIPLKVSRS